MPLFKLNLNGSDISKAELVEAAKTTLELEKHLEAWLERSPWAIAEEPLLLIGRQTSAAVEDGTVFPDLLALDSEGNIVVVELKRGKAPREVTAQLLEYAAWVSELSDTEIADIAAAYRGIVDKPALPVLAKLFCDTFEAEELPPLNQRQRLFIAAEEIPHSVSRVCRFLRTNHGMDVNCVKFSVFQTGAGEILVSSDWIVGREDVELSKKVLANRWTGEKPVKEVVWDAVKELTHGDKTVIFSPKEVTHVVHKSFPTFNRSTITCQLTSDCVNHTSRHHYPGGEDRYWWLEKGKYRLFDATTDKMPPASTTDVIRPAL